MHPLFEQGDRGVGQPSVNVAASCKIEPLARPEAGGRGGQIRQGDADRRAFSARAQGVEVDYGMLTVNRPDDPAADSCCLGSAVRANCGYAGDEMDRCARGRDCLCHTQFMRGIQMMARGSHCCALPRAIAQLSRVSFSLEYADLLVAATEPIRGTLGKLWAAGPGDCRPRADQFWTGFHLSDLLAKDDRILMVALCLLSEI